MVGENGHIIENRPLPKTLNLYAGLGGNRRLWPSPVTAVEIDEEVADLYRRAFPDDTVIVGDAHQYLLDHYHEFDFIWSSFPCTTHTRMNVNFNLARYPDLRLYEEILFLKHYFKGKYCVENVMPYYEPLIAAQQFNRHLFWANFKIICTDRRNPPKQIQAISAQHSKRRRRNYDGHIVNMKTTQPHYGFDISDVKLKHRKDALLRNCVDPEIGLIIFNQALGILQRQTRQAELFAI